MSAKGKFPIFLFVPYYGTGATVVVDSITITASSSHDIGNLSIDWRFNDPNIAQTLSPDEMSKIKKYVLNYVMDYIK